MNDALSLDPTTATFAMPAKRWETAVSAYLAERGYAAECIRFVLSWTAIYGSVECCPEMAFDANDRAAVEALLPESPQWSAPEWQDRITLTHGLVDTLA